MTTDRYNRSLRCGLSILAFAVLPGLVLAGAGPDREVTIGVVSPIVLASGEEITINVQVFNIGSVATSDTTLRYYLSSDASISTTDEVIDSQVISSLGPGSGSNLQGFGTVVKPPGTYWVGACVDEDPEDVNPLNDCTSAMEISIPDIDLAVLPVSVGSNTFPSGQTVSLESAVDNRGTQESSASTLRYKLSGNSTISSGDIDIVTAAIPPIAGGERWLNQTQSAITAEPGSYWIGACADVVDKEFSTSNNCSSGTPVEILDDDLPDLVVDEVSANPDSWNEGEFTDLFARVRNQGTASSQATEIRFYLSSDSTITTSDMLQGIDNVDGLAANATQETGIFVAPQPAPGNYWFGACVDPDGVEFITGNNCSSGVPVTVSENTNACTDLPIQCGETLASSLTSGDCDDSPRGTGFLAKKHSFEGSSGDQVTITAEWTLDGYLYLVNPSGVVVAENDNDDDNVLRSRIENTLNAAGTWTIWTTTEETALEPDFELTLACVQAPGADLVIDSPSVAPDSVMPGQNVILSATVRNQGPGDSAGTTVYFLLSSDDVIEASDTVLASLPQGALGAGGGLSAVQADVAAPLGAGNYWVGLCVDAVPNEENTANNCSAAVPLTVNENTNACAVVATQCGQLSAQQLDSQDCDDSPRGTGYLARSHVFAANGGDLVTIDVAFDGDGYLYLTDSMGEVLAENDDAGDMLTSRVEFGIQDGGQYTAWVTTANPARMLAYDLELTCASTAETDLSVDPPTPDPLTVDFGDVLSLSTTVRNAGPDAAAPTELRYLISTDAVISLGDSNIRTSQVPGIAGGGSFDDTVVTTTLIEPGFYWVGACVDAVIGETDVGNNCSAGVEIEITDGPGIPFNQGLNDAWFNAVTGGQGFFINVFSDIGKVFLAWFTYDLERPDSSVQANLGGPGHRWLTAFGDFQDGVATLDIEKTSGGVFNSAEPGPVQTLDGTITLRFATCGEGSVAFAIPSVGISGVVPIQRLGDDNISWCDELIAAASTAQQAPQSRVAAVSRPEGVADFRINEGLNDAWFNPDTGGQGFFINVFPAIGKMFLSWFTYETARPAGSVTAQLGEPGHRWLTAFGDYSGNQAVLDIEKTTGGVFNQAEPNPVQVPDGTITVEFADCENGTVTFDIESIGQQGIVPIQRLALDSVAACEALDAAAAQSDRGTNPE
ncbi:CARDB domain-containing protein [Elongatibacter sediminis]|uniref:CARDB domain-containing protein n=1 Tax=Elongatibacter sediminis TaxID=3119006 RepID=A0AAW9R725_9GAMM